MKNIFYACCVIAMILSLRKAFLDPTGVRGYKIYSGAREDTKIVLNIPMLSTSINLPRFPGDVLVYSPIKLVNYVDINVLEKSDSPQEYKAYITNAISEELSLAYCYLRMLQEYKIELPLKFTSADINYDVSSFLQRDGVGFTLSTVSLDEFSQKPLENLLKSITIQAKRDTIEMFSATDNCIVKLSSGNKTRYVWGYYLSGDYLYVIDPCAPQLSYARISLSTGEYWVGTSVYKVQSFIRKLKVPLIEGETGINKSLDVSEIGDVGLVDFAKLASLSEVSLPKDIMNDIENIPEEGESNDF